MQVLLRVPAPLVPRALASLARPAPAPRVRPVLVRQGRRAQATRKRPALAVHLQHRRQPHHLLRVRRLETPLQIRHLAARILEVRFRHRRVLGRYFRRSVLVYRLLRVTALDRRQPPPTPENREVQPNRYLVQAVFLLQVLLPLVLVERPDHRTLGGLRTVPR